MGKEKTSGTTVVQQKTTPTPEETELNKLQLEQSRATQSGTIQAQQQSLGLINKLLTGSTDLPGFFGQLGEGISPDVTNRIVQQAMRDIAPQFQASGILDSGTAASIAARTAGDIRVGAEEYNLGNKFNLLNLAFGGQAQVQQPLLATSGMLGNRLAGLRSSTQTTNTASYAPNPFLTSFQNSLGSSLGKVGGSFGKWSIGG